MNSGDLPANQGQGPRNPDHSSRILQFNCSFITAALLPPIKQSQDWKGRNARYLGKGQRVSRPPGGRKKQLLFPTPLVSAASPLGFLLHLAHHCQSFGQPSVVRKATLVRIHLPQTWQLTGWYKKSLAPFFTMPYSMTEPTRLDNICFWVPVLYRTVVSWTAKVCFIFGHVQHPACSRRSIMFIKWMTKKMSGWKNALRAMKCSLGNFNITYYIILLCPLWIHI